LKFQPTGTELPPSQETGEVCKPERSFPSARPTFNSRARGSGGNHENDASSNYFSFFGSPSG
jgi:hypothetical protein